MGRLAGVEVPVFTTEVNWLDLSVPSDLIPQQSSTLTTDLPLSFATPSLPQNAVAGFSASGNPHNYLLWRIHESMRSAVELVEFSVHGDIPKIGVRFVFPSDLFSSVYVQNEQTGSRSGDCVRLYALTVSGIAYCIVLQSLSTYKSCSSVPHDHILCINLHNYKHYGAITTIAASAGQFLVGRDDGSVGCFQLQATPGDVHELRDDGGISRLWGLIARNRIAGAVQDMVILEMLGRNLAFVLHLDGILKVWDLQGYNRVFNYDTATGMPAGSTHLRLWVGKAIADESVVPFAIHCRSNDETNSELLNAYDFHFSLSERISLSVNSTLSIVLEEAKLIDVKFESDNIWILNDDGLQSHHLLRGDPNAEDTQSYSLQESVLAEQLFQNAEHASYDLLSICLSIFSSTKDQTVQSLSSVFLRRLLHPSVYDDVIMRKTLQAYNRHFSIAEFECLDCDGVKKQILSLIERESASRSPLSIFYSWKAFCTCYFDHWCKHNVPYGLLADSTTGAIGLIRKQSVSLIRGLENVEMILYGSIDEGDCTGFGLTLSLDKLECEVLIDVLRCLNNISLQLGKSASVVMYEAFLEPCTSGPEEIVTGLLKILEIGYASSEASVHMFELGRNVAREKQMIEHKSFRKFSVDMLLSLRALCQKATSWTSVLKVIESYLKLLVPQKITLNSNCEKLSKMEACIAVQATCQTAKVMFECAADVLLFLGYLLKISGQIHMSDRDISHIQLELLPMVQDIVTEWLIIQFLAATPTQGPTVEDFSSQLSSLNIDGDHARLWSDKLGKCHYSLAYILLANMPNPAANGNHHLLRRLPDSQRCMNWIRNFTGWVVWGTHTEESAAFSRHFIHVAIVLLRQCQYKAVENLLTVVQATLQRERICESIQESGCEWFAILHLLGCCILAQACELHGNKKERKVSEAVRCFFRASAGKEAPKAIQYLSGETGAQHCSLDYSLPYATWKLQYFQWAMQIFEQYKIYEGATQFAHAALEQVDEAVEEESDLIQNESITSIRGRLWANIFKFTLDLNQYFDAYCAMISNPDPESKCICLRRFLIVLFERGSIKILCDGQFPFVGLMEKVEQELSWKAERSDISVKPNPYKLLYAFEIHRHKWRKAATFIYKYSNRLKGEMSPKDHQFRSLMLLERLNSLSATINALHLVDPAYAWIDSLSEQSSSYTDHLPSKRARIHDHKHSETTDHIQKVGSITNLEKLEKEYVLASAEYLLSLSNASWTPSGHELPSDLVDLLVQTNLYDMAFTVVLKFWKDISLKRELERVFQSLSIKCCPVEVRLSVAKDNSRANGHLLTYSEEYMGFDYSPDAALLPQNADVSTQWDLLKTYTENYISYNARLPVIVAQTVLQADPQIELPVWLVHMFKVDKNEKKWGMAGQESSPAKLFEIYVDCGRYTEATNLLLEYIESYSSVRPNDIIYRKKTSSAWFPYTTIEHLCCKLDQMIKLGRMVDQCNKLKTQIYTTLERHLKMLKVDSEDAVSSSLPTNTSTTDMMQSY